MTHEAQTLSVRDQLRKELLANHRPESIPVTLFGQKIELRQPTLDSVLKARETDDKVERVLDMILKYAYVPDTDQPVFEPGDKELMKKWPWGPDLMNVNNAIMKLTGIDISAAEKELQTDPLDEQS